MIRLFSSCFNCFNGAASSSSSSNSLRMPKAEGSSSVGAISGMKPKEAPLAGYLMARAAMHRKVEGQDLKNLRAGHESLQQGGDLLPLGRANVIQDIEKAKESYLPVRNTVASKMRDFQFAHLGYPSLAAAPRNIKNRVVAAAGQYFKTGTCHSYSANILPLHAAQLPGMKDERSIVALCNYPKRDHVWPEMIPKETREDGTPILHGKDVKYLKAEIDSNRDWKRKCDYYIQSLVNSGMNVGERGRRNAESVFHADFREQAGRALHKNVLKAIA